MMRINKKFLIVFLFILLLEVFIALFINDHFIRPFLGDVFVILLIFFFIRSFFPVKNTSKLAVEIFLFACLIEICQYLQVLELLHLQDSAFLSIVLGSTFDWLDILAYASGTLALLVISRKENEKADNPSPK